MARQRRLPIMVPHGGLARESHPKAVGPCLETMASDGSDWWRVAAAGQMDWVDLRIATASEDFTATLARVHVPSVPLWHVDALFGRHASRRKRGARQQRRMGDVVMAENFAPICNGGPPGRVRVLAWSVREKTMEHKDKEGSSLQQGYLSAEEDDSSFRILDETSTRD
ncbi:MAG: hypothetical protein Q9225_002516 [Loekoesia sp. 1 TL-2023]